MAVEGSEGENCLVFGQLGKIKPHAAIGSCDVAAMRWAAAAEHVRLDAALGNGMSGVSVVRECVRAAPELWPCP